MYDLRDLVREKRAELAAIEADIATLELAYAVMIRHGLPHVPKTTTQRQGERRRVLAADPEWRKREAARVQAWRDRKKREAQATMESTP